MFRRFFYGDIPFLEEMEYLKSIWLQNNPLITDYLVFSSNNFSNTGLSVFFHLSQNVKYKP